jgi:hypothetical protein
VSIESLVAFVTDRDRERFDLFAQQGSEPSEVDVAELEAKVGFRLPDDVRTLLLHPLGGLYVEASESVWPRAQAFDVGPFWTFLRGVQVYGLSPEAPDFLDMEVAHDALVSDGVEGLVPVLKVLGDPDLYCVGADGRIVRWHHDDPDAEPEPVGLDLLALLLREIAELDARIDRRAELP